MFEKQYYYTYCAGISILTMVRYKNIDVPNVLHALKNNQIIAQKDLQS